MFPDAANPNTVTPNPPPMNCADGWTAYWYACYKLVTEVKNWQDAENHCTQQNAKGGLSGLSVTVGCLFYIKCFNQIFKSIFHSLIVNHFCLPPFNITLNKFWTTL